MSENPSINETTAVLTEQQIDAVVRFFGRREIPKPGESFIPCGAPEYGNVIVGADETGQYFVKIASVRNVTAQAFVEMIDANWALWKRYVDETEWKQVSWKDARRTIEGAYHHPDLLLPMFQNDPDQPVPFRSIAAQYEWRKF